MTADEIREQFKLSKQALTNYLNLGVLTPVPGTEDSKNPLYYTDEVAVIREALTTCDSSIKRLNSIRNNVLKEIFHANAALAVLQLDDATKESVANSIIDSISLFLTQAIPNVDKSRVPLYWLLWKECPKVEEFVEYFSCVENRHNIYDYCKDLYEEVAAIDATSLLNIIDDKAALEKENQALKDRIKELEEKIEILGPTSEQYIANHGFVKELTEKQVEGLRKDVFDCGFTVRVLNCLKAQTTEDYYIETLKEVVMIKPTELKRFRNFGKNSLQEIIDKLAEYDLTLGMSFFEANGKIYTK